MRLAFLFGASTLLAACSSNASGNSTPDAGNEAASSTGDAAEAGGAQDGTTAGDAQGDAPLACNALANVGQTVTLLQVAQDPPQPQGGTVVSGTYTLTDFTLYTGPTGPTGPSGSSQTTIQIAGDIIQVATAGTPATQTVTLATTGTAFTATDTCPDTKVTTGMYTATATTFVVFLNGGTDDAGARTLVETFTLQ
jgi:hypothetical protein